MYKIKQQRNSYNSNYDANKFYIKTNSLAI